MNEAADTGAAPSEAPGGRRLAPFVAIGVALVVGVLFVILLRAAPAGGESADTPLIGQIAPAAVGELDDGAWFDLARRKGSWVVLNFFTHNCVPCIREHPELVSFVEQQRALGVDGAEFYTIVRDSTRDEVAEFFAERGGDWPVVYDPRTEFYNGFGVALVPETWIVDPGGYVCARVISEVTADGLSSLLQQFRLVETCNSPG